MDPAARGPCHERVTWQEEWTDYPEKGGKPVHSGEFVTISPEPWWWR